MAKERKTSLVALRDRRDGVIEILSNAFAEDLIDVETFEDRVSSAHRATALAKPTTSWRISSRPQPASATPSSPKRLDL